MAPSINDTNVWQQASMLMQPAFIRLIDNIRKQLDVSSWKGTYQDVLVWADGTSDETKAMVTSLVEELETATPERTDEIKQTLSKLPMPQPGYHLCLQRQEQRQEVDIWELCYQVCFQNYPSEQPVSIDTSLIDAEGEVDWNTLDSKAKHIVDTMFQNLQ